MIELDADGKASRATPSTEFHSAAKLDPARVRAPSPAAEPAPEDRMEMKKLSGGNLRAAGFDPARRVLVVELNSGTFEYGGVSADTFRRHVGASSPWSFFRDNIEEEYPAKRIR